MCPVDANAPGECVSRPAVCAAVFEPVCGCDGEQYPNQCSANMAGVDVFFEGECNFNAAASPAKKRRRSLLAVNEATDDVRQQRMVFSATAATVGGVALVALVVVAVMHFRGYQHMREGLPQSATL